MSLILLNIIGAVFVLLLGTLLVRQGFTRAFGINLRRIIQIGTKNRAMAFLSGLGVTALLQSSTATSLLAMSFAKKGLLSLALALALVIGADISTTLVAQIFSFDLSWMSPLFLSIGIFIYLGHSDHTVRGNIARIFIGLGLMLLALGLVRDAASPLREFELLPQLLAPLADDPLFAILFSALLTWMIHSSLASVLLFSSFAVGGFIDLELGLLFILGANLGGALIPLVITFKDSPIARQIALGNLFMRFITLIGVMIALPNIIVLFEQNEWMAAQDLGHQMVHAHSAFNILLAVIFLPMTTLLSKAVRLIISDKDMTEGKNKAMYLDKTALDTPAVALSNATRESLRMAEIVEQMLDQTITCFSSHSQDLIEEVRITDHQVDTLYRKIKHYMATLSARGIDEQYADQYFQILTFATNMEHIGDIIDKSLMELALKKIRKQGEFSEAGYKEIRDFHKMVVENMRLAQSVFVSGDNALAAQLIQGKRDIRKAADRTFAKHFQRLENSNSASVETSSIHLDIIRDYRQINNYATRLSYMILEQDKPPLTIPE